MNIEEAIYTHLVGNAGVLALAGNRVYPLNLPQNPSYPAITYRRVTTRRVMAHDGPEDLGFPRFQFDCYAVGYREVRDLANALRAALNGYRGIMGGGVEVDGVIFLNEVDDFGDTAEVFRVTVDFLIVHKE